ncbi:SIS domain-containing protein [bacterium]|nr:SIS domain-containing protein [bacterium]
MQAIIQSYLDDISSLMSNISESSIEKVLDILYEAYQKDRRVFLFGNGGAAATSTHLACDLAKGATYPDKRRFKVLSLSENISILTAWANDTDYTNIFGEQLRNFLQPDDVVIGLSASGMSPNVINALKIANEMGAITILFSGYDGGKAAREAQHTFVVPTKNIQQIEDVHLIISHILYTCLRKKIFS